jgi:hypothetical protein
MAHDDTFSLTKSVVVPNDATPNLGLGSTEILDTRTTPTQGCGPGLFSNVIFTGHPCSHL